MRQSGSSRPTQKTVVIFPGKTGGIREPTRRRKSCPHRHAQLPDARSAPDAAGLDARIWTRFATRTPAVPIGVRSAKTSLAEAPTEPAQSRKAARASAHAILSQHGIALISPSAGLTSAMDSRMSPIPENLPGLPPTPLQSASEETLRDNSRRLAADVAFFRERAMRADRRNPFGNSRGGPPERGPANRRRRRAEAATPRRILISLGTVAHRQDRPRNPILRSVRSSEHVARRREYSVAGRRPRTATRAPLTRLSRQ